VESSKANRKTAAEAIEILATAYRSSSYFEKTTDQIGEMKSMVSGVPVTIEDENIPDSDDIFLWLFSKPTEKYRTDCKEQ
jgi:hypothetical protein